MKLSNFIRKSKKKKAVKVDDSDLTKSAHNKIKVRVYMRFGAEVRQKRAEFYAQETKDGYNNLVAINEEVNFNEDCDFKMHDVYSSLAMTYKVNSDQRPEALKKIEEEIDRREKRILALIQHPELNKFSNIWDEKRKLRELEIFKRYVKNRSDNGAYFKMEDGLRVYEYESVDGFLIPIWHGVDNLSDTPDFTQEKKITMQETANFYDYFESKGNRKLLLSTLSIVLVVVVVLFVINVVAGFKLLDKHQDLDDRMLSGSEKCYNEVTRSYEVFSTLIQNTYIKDYLDNRNNETTFEEEKKKITDLILRR